MGNAGVLKGWEDLGCSEPNMLLDVFCFSRNLCWLHSTARKALSWRYHHSAQYPPPYCLLKANDLLM